MDDDDLLRAKEEWCKAFASEDHVLRAMIKAITMREHMSFLTFAVMYILNGNMCFALKE